MTTPTVETRAYLQAALANQDTYAVVSQDANGNLTIAAEIGPGVANLGLVPLQGPTGPAGISQFPLHLQEEVLNDPSLLPTDLGPTSADVGRYWLIDQKNEATGEITSTGAYIWFGYEFRFLPFGNEGPPGPYGVIAPFVSLIGPDQTSQLVVDPDTDGSSANPYLATVELSVPEGPVGPCCPVAQMVDFVPESRPTVGQFITATGETVSYEGDNLPLWAPTNVGDIVPACYTVPQSAFKATSGIILQAQISVAGTGGGASTLMSTTSFSWSHNAPAGADVFAFTACSGTAVPSAVTFGGAAMTLLGSSVANGGAVSLWHLASVTGGSHNVVATIPVTASTYITGNSVAFLNVGSVSTAATSHANNTLAFQGISCGAQQVILQGTGYAGLPLFPYGGLTTTYNTAASGTKAALQTAYALSPSDFGSLGATANGWNAIGVVLSPVESIATIAQFAVPANAWPWKPVVFGQIQMFEIELSLNPLSIGIEVLLGSPDSRVGTLVARGFGNTTGGVVTIFPHTSSPSAPDAAMTPWNTVGLVPASHGGPDATLYVNVINDGIAAVYNYNPQGAELFVMACPATTQAQLGQVVYGSLPLKVTLAGRIAEDVRAEVKGVGTLSPGNVFGYPVTQEFRKSGSYTPPSWWVNGTDYLDVISIGAGGGASTANDFDAGGPGAAGAWATTTIQSLTSGALTVAIGSPGVGAIVNTNGSAGGATVVKDGSSTVLSASGGAGGTYIGGGTIGGTGWYGPSAGSKTYEAQTYYGGLQTTKASNPGHWPGGGGSGADFVFLRGGSGASGAVWIVARKA